jgi:hypothetical protein
MVSFPLRRGFVPTTRVVRSRLTRDSFPLPRGFVLTHTGGRSQPRRFVTTPPGLRSQSPGGAFPLTGSHSHGRSVPLPQRCVHTHPVGRSHLRGHGHHPPGFRSNPRDFVITAPWVRAQSQGRSFPLPRVFGYNTLVFVTNAPGGRAHSPGITLGVVTTHPGLRSGTQCWICSVTAVKGSRSSV